MTVELPIPHAAGAGRDATMTDRENAVSAIVLNYNGEHLLRIILPSLTRQTRPAEQIVVVDNGSTDGSTAYLARLWPEIEVVAIPTNVGVAAALNRGVEAASGSHIALLNNDLELTETWLQEMVAGLKRHPDAGSVACKLRSYADRQRLDGAGDKVTRAMVAVRRGSGELDLGQYDTEEEILTPTAGAALYRARALARVGPFDESFYAYFEDVDWGLRAQLFGFTSWYLPRAVGYHMGGATTGGDRNPRYWKLHQRNRIGLMVKDLPLQVLIGNLGPILREQAGGLVHSAKHRLLRMHLQAFASALRCLPGWIRARWQIQRSRQVSATHLNRYLSD